MAYQATVIPVMIASPSDVRSERQIVRDVLHEWNYTHSLNAKTILMPVAWETHSAPDLGGRPQELINNRVLNECDVLVGVFWTKVGTPTGEAASGTIEEIQRHIAVERLAMVYFSEAPVVLSAVDREQYATLLDFKEWCKNRGLYGSYSSVEEFKNIFRSNLQTNLYKNDRIRKLLGSALKLPSNAGAATPTNIGQFMTFEAKQLLCEAAQDMEGIIIHREWLGGQAVQTNNKSFGDGASPRELAKWLHALRQLTAGTFLERDDTEKAIYRVTSLGFQTVDQMLKAPDAQIML